MPHISRFKLNGSYIPSVSTVTGALAKPGLERWFRKLGFEEADRQSKEAREQGTEVAEMFEAYRKVRKQPRKKFLKTVLNEWLQWGEGWDGVMLVAEPHLVNTIDNYHGSPDLVYKDGEAWSIGDDKCKKRFADYGLLMNEHAYAMCNMIHDTETDEIKPVPWSVPIQRITFWTYSPETGRLYPHEHTFDEAVYGDFLRCRNMYDTNKTAEHYFQENAITLPEETNV
jgi:hypothetical protein